MIRKINYWSTILVVVSSVLFIPAIRTDFWWIDDGTSIQAARTIIDSIKGFNLETLGFMFEGGRSMVVYWFYHLLEYLVGGNNPTLHFTFHFLIILGTSLLIFGTVKKLTNSNFSALFAGLLFILVPLNFENLYRLGPQEPILSLFIAASIYFLYKENIKLSIIFLLLSSLTKETGFVLWVPFFSLYLIKMMFFGKNDKDLAKYSLWGAALTLPAILNVLFRRTGYSSNYVFSIDQIVSNFGGYIKLVIENYAPFFTVFLVTLLIRAAIAIKGKVKKDSPSFLNQFAFLLFFILYLLILSPWRHQLGRYLMPGTVALSIFLSIELNSVKHFLERHKFRYSNTLTVVFLAYLLFFSGINLFRAYVYGEMYADETNLVQSIFKNVATTAPPNSLILYNFKNAENTREYLVQTGIQLELFYNRKDIQVDYLDLEVIPNREFEIIGTTLVKEGYPEKMVEDSLNYTQKQEYLSEEKTYPLLTNPANMITEMAKKAYNLVVSREAFTSSGLIAYYYSKDGWYRLKEAK